LLADEANERLAASRLQTVGSGLAWILPYLQQDNLFKEWNTNVYYFAQATSAQQTTVPFFFCPSRRRPMVSRFLRRFGPCPSGQHRRDLARLPG
jgi:hypothetical protein